LPAIHSRGTFFSFAPGSSPFQLITADAAVGRPCVLATAYPNSALSGFLSISLSTSNTVRVAAPADAEVAALAYPARRWRRKRRRRKTHRCAEILPGPNFEG